MTDNEIIKALECCGKEDYKLCSKCPLYIADHDNDFCQEDLHKASLDRINRQKAEIERLKELLEEWKTEAYKVADEKDELYWDCIDKGRKAKAEAVKEFAEQIKMAFYYEFDELIPSIMADKIDNLVKETVGEAE